MRINEYKRVLEGLDDIELDQLQFKHLENSVVLVYPENPPFAWSHCSGSITRSTEAKAVDPALATESGRPKQGTGRGGAARQHAAEVTLQPCLLLDGFVSDMNEAFGEQITRDCVNAHFPEQGKPLTARVVKQLIDSAEKRVVDLDIAGIRRKSECRETNDNIIARFLKDKYWSGLLFPEPDVEIARGMQENGRFLIPENGARFIRKMITVVCRRLPEYSDACLTQAMLDRAAGDVRAIHDFMCANPYSNRLAFDTVWTLLDQALETLGLNHVEKIWPAYLAAAIAFSYLTQKPGSSALQELASEISQNHDWSSAFLASIAPFYLEEILQEIENKPQSGASADIGWQAMFDSVMSSSRNRALNILETHLELLSALGREKGLTEWQKRVMTSELERAPCSRASFSALIKLIESTCRTLVSLPKQRGAAGVFDLVTTVSAAVAESLSSSTGHDQRLAATLSVVVAGLSPGQARGLLQHVRDFDKPTRELLVKHNVPRSERFCDTLVAMLQQRAMQASDEFQIMFLDLVRNDQARRAAMLPVPGIGAVSDEFTASLVNSTIVLTVADGQSIIDLQFLGRLKGENTRRDFVESSLFETLTFDPHDPGDQKCVTLLTNTISAMKDAVLRVCSKTIFKHDHSGMLYLSDNTLVQKLDDDLDTSVEITLVETVGRDIHFRYAYRIMPIRIAFDMSGTPRWIDPESSHFLIEAECVLYPAGGIALAAPLSCTTNLVRSRWPESRTYPQPMVRDLLGGIQVNGQLLGDKMLTRSDLFDFAEANGNQMAMTAMSALKAIRRFIEAPADQALDCAIRVYEEFIKKWSFDFLDNRETLGNILQELFPRMDPTGAILALEAFARSVLDLPELAKTASPESHYAIDQLLELIAGAPSASIVENRQAFQRLLELLETPGTPLSQYVVRVPVEVSIDLIERLGLFASRLDAQIFSALEKDLTDFLGGECLPLFIQSVLSQSDNRSSRK